MKVYQKPKLTKHSQLKSVTFSVENPGDHQPSGGYLKAGQWGNPDNS
jgi:hypothetical protein